MKKIFLISTSLFATLLFAQNNNNAENRQDIKEMNQLKGDSMITNTYNLEMNLSNQEPASLTNIFQDPREGDVSWKDINRDQAGNIVYDIDPFENNGKVKWQDYANWSSREKQGVWEPMPYSYVSEDDVVWAKRITREIMVNEPNNAGLKYPKQTEYTNHSGELGSFTNFNEVLTGIDARKNLFTILYDAAMSGQVNVYNRKMSRLFSDAEILGDGSDKDNLIEGVFSYVVDDKKPVVIDGITTLVETTSFLMTGAEQVLKYEIVEDWFFDKRRSKMDVRIISITPVCRYEIETVDPDGDVQSESGFREAGTFYYPEVRDLLVNHKIYNTQNLMARMSFDEFFQRRLFSSNIVKESNVYDRDITEYIIQTDYLSQLLEGERIKENIRTFEHNAWEY